MISNTDFILAESPYYITYSATASTFDYATVELFIWTGDNTIPTTANYPLTAIKIRYDDNFVTCDISDYILGHLDPTIDDTWFDYLPLTVDSTEVTVDSTEITVDSEFLNAMSTNEFGEFVWVKWILKAYKVIGDVTTLQDTVDSSIHIGCLGKGYHINGANSTPPSMTLLDPVDKYSTQLTTNFRVTISPTASNTSSIVFRQPIFTNKIICSQKNREFQVAYLNSFGVWDTMLFNRASRRNLNISSESSQFYQKRPDQYSVRTGTTRVQNVVIGEEWVLNTDLLDDAQNKYMEELVSSNRWYLLNQADETIIPVILTDKKLPEKLSKYEKAQIQWTLTFENANNKINDIR